MTRGTGRYSKEDHIEVYIAEHCRKETRMDCDGRRGTQERKGM